MDKTEIVKRIIAYLEEDLDTIAKAALESAESATDEEVKAESQYDTRGLETSYLAAGQAHHAKELKEELEAYKNLEIPEGGIDCVIGSLVTTLSDKGKRKYFVGPAQGGLEFEDDDGKVVVVTPKSPLGSAMIGHRVGSKVRENETIIRIE